MNGLDCLNKLSSTMQQHWLKEIAELDNPIDYLTSEYDEFDHFYRYLIGQNLLKDIHSGLNTWIN